MTGIHEVAKTVFGKQNRVNVDLKFLDAVYEDIHNSAGDVGVNKNVL